MLSSSEKLLTKGLILCNILFSCNSDETLRPQSVRKIQEDIHEHREMTMPLIENLVLYLLLEF